MDACSTAYPHEILLSCEPSLLQAGIAATLEAQPGLRVSIAAPLSAQQLRGGRFAVLVCDYDTGLRVLALAAQAPGPTPPRVLIVSAQARESEVQRAIELGAYGFFLQCCTPERLTQAVRLLAQGQRCFDDAVVPLIASCMSRNRLTGREQEVLQLLAQGLGNKQIALRLSIALGTVKAHVKAILEKLPARTRTEAAALAQQRGLLPWAPASHEEPRRARPAGTAERSYAPGYAAALGN